MRLSKKRFLILSLYGAVVSTTLLSLGCGGGNDPLGGSASPTATPVGTTPTPSPAPIVGRGSARFTVDWTQPPSGSVPVASQSVRVIIKQGIEPIFQQVVSRPSGSNTSTLDIPNLPAEGLSVVISAYPSNNGSGVPQATAGFRLVIAERATTEKTILLASSVTSVIVTTAQPSLTNTSTSELLATALNVDGNVVLTAPSRWTWSTDSPQILALTPNGSAATVQQGVLDGTGTVTARETETGIQGQIALSAPEPRQGRVTASLSWGARSRAASGLTSALSARITVEDPRPRGTLSFLVNRDTVSLAAYTRSYTSTEFTRVGPKTVTITFYAQPDGQGAVVGVAQGTATLLPDGSGLGSYTTNGTIKTVTLALGSSNIFVRRTTTLIASPRDSNNFIVAVTPGSFLYQVASGTASSLQFGQNVSGNDIVTGLSAGNVQLTVSVDGLTSAPTPLTITPLGGVILDIQ